jgi:putative transposase
VQKSAGGLSFPKLGLPHPFAPFLAKGGKTGALQSPRMRVKPVRYQNQRCLHFITFSCYRRMKLLDDPNARDLFEHELERVRVWYGCYITAYVVMPEHVHLLIGEPGRKKLSVVIQMLKQITSRRLRPSGLPHFWQVRYYDFAVWSEEKCAEKITYIHRNPVTRGLVTLPEDWKWSSFLPWAEGAEGRVEIECPATARKRERVGLQSTA